ncbi:AQG_2a_G0028890.mRNA.1.CDS.1 [Saccharomyces cerevisiae]|nr:BDF_1d_G0028580.mRNA.1.CDS.1 [Saccharomyces cerevisiae]CAI4538923.1 BDC_1c_G0028620.mRNA.1.CDS.1 [Saccharomyces cerevisiae]CAI4557149.1 AQG_2a_G0028890.mRNA.1.CDS.1 [Saccharomyces cerevisiae]CAI7171900.1 BDF_1d_G0028580.mRNA.1.CDS.1 [Saccharomyces cerevisiae]CAI7174021.1 AQG_2a_G0028890.mRNA.1.CDS.1 [Saccharomyces cerevisiae]
MFNQLLLEPNMCKISPDIHFTNNKTKMLQKMFLSTKLNYCLYHVTELRLAVFLFTYNHHVEEILQTYQTSGHKPFV